MPANEVCSFLVCGMPVSVIFQQMPQRTATNVPILDLIELYASKTKQEAVAHT
jgi:hypothetical protein